MCKIQENYIMEIEEIKFQFLVTYQDTMMSHLIKLISLFFDINLFNFKWHILAKCTIQKLIYSLKLC